MSKSLQRRLAIQSKHRHGCEHDLMNPVRIGRANYICRLCKANISLHVVMMAQAGAYDDPPRKKLIRHSLDLNASTQIKKR